MTKIKASSFITEIKNNILEKDAVKAEIVLSHIVEMELAVQKEALDLLADGKAMHISCILKFFRMESQIVVDI